MKRASLSVLAMLVTATAMAPMVSGAGGLTVLIFVGPEGQGEGGVISVNLEVYQDGVLADLDSVNASVGIFSGLFLDFVHQSTGKYSASYTITASDVAAGYVSFYGSADLGLNSESIFEFYSTGTGTAVGWTVVTRIVNVQQVAAAGPGSSVVVEARSYHDGTLADGGAINFTGNWMDGQMFFSGSSNNITLTGTKVSDGVYQTTVQIPADLSKTRSYRVEAALGSSSQTTTGFQAHPFRVMAFAQSASATSASVHAFVGGDTAVSGATLSLSGQAVTSTPPFFTTVGPFTATTGANGQAVVNATWSLSTMPAYWVLNVTSGANMVSMLVSFPTAGAQSWIPTPPLGFGCEVNLQTDPSTFQPGQSANIKFRVTDSGNAVASTSISRFAWRDGALSSSAAGNVTTDATGNFTLVYAFPANWESTDTLVVRVVCPSGDTADDHVQTSGGFGFGSSKLTVSASGRLGGPLAITATYSGTNALTNAQAVAIVVPGNQTSLAGIGLAGGGITTALVRSGSSFTGTVTVPAWLGEGDFTVLVVVTNAGGTSSQTDQTTEGNGTVVHLTPQGSTGGNNPPSGGGFIPGFEGTASVAAVAALGAVLAVARRRRRLD